MRRIIAVLVALLCLSMFGCASEPVPVGAEPELTTATPSLLSALGMAEGLQRRADELEALGDLAAATASVEAIFAIEFPAGASDRQDVRLDAYARLGELALAGADLEAASAAIARGAAEADRDSYFHARLLLTRGRIEQAHAAALREANDPSARDASLRAIATLEESIDMNQRVLTALAQEDSP